MQLAMHLESPDLLDVPAWVELLAVLDFGIAIDPCKVRPADSLKLE